MGMIHKKSRTTGKRPRRTGEKVAQNTGTDFLALGLGVVLSLPTFPCTVSVAPSQLQQNRNLPAPKPREDFSERHPEGLRHTNSLRLLNALNSEDRGLKVRFSLAMIAFETFELILCQMLSSQEKNAPSNPYPHYLVRLATSRN